jgi:hypothetical protein
MILKNFVAIYIQILFLIPISIFEAISALAVNVIEGCAAFFITRFVSIYL